jgi:CRP/FNR family transcriptional regulator, cyclic AMP receptor protein
MSHAPLLQQVEIFADLRPDQLERISTICSELRYQEGDIIFQENSNSDELYIILKGEVEIQVDPRTLGTTDKSDPTTVARLRKGQSFGEVALVDGGIRTASARCGANNTQVLVLERTELIAQCQHDFEMGYVLMRNLASDLALKIRQTDLMVRQQLLWSHATGGPEPDETSS